MRYGISLYSAPAVEPLSLAEAKQHLRVVASDDDSYVTALITAARLQAEQLTGRQLINATWDLYLDEFPYGCDAVILLPKSPLVSVTSIVYTATDGTSTTITASDYIVSTSREPGQVSLAYGAAWPVARDVADAVRVRYVAGYGAAGSSVPEPIRQAMKLMIGHWWENREDVVIGTISSEVPNASKWLLEPYKVGEEFTCYAPESCATA